jgi:hypothetical protein
MKSIKVRKAGRMVKPKKKKKITEEERKRNAFRWKQELRGI